MTFEGRRPTLLACAWTMVAFSSCASDPRSEGSTSLVRTRLQALPSVSPEFAIDPTIRGVPDAGSGRIALAAGPSGYLSFWMRTETAELRAARLDEDGHVLDTSGLHVATARADATYRVVRTANEYVAIWAEATSSDGTRVMAQRIADAGALVGGADQLATFSNPTSIGEPATDGERILVPLGGPYAGRGLLCEPGSSGATLIDIVADPSGLNAGNAVYDGTEYVVAYFNPSVGLARVSTLGFGTGALEPLGMSATSAPKIEANAEKLAVLHENAGSLSLTTLSDAPATTFVASAVAGDYFELGATPGGYAIVWMRNGPPSFETHKLSVDLEGTPTSTATLLTRQFPIYAIATGARGPFAAVARDGFWVSSSTSVGPITAVPALQSEPAMAASRSAFLAVWAEQRDADPGHLDIRGGRIAGDGTVLDTAGIAIASAGPATRFATPRVSSDGVDFLVTYNDGSRATAIPVSAEGEVGTPRPLEPLDYWGSNPTAVRASYDGTNYLAVWPAAVAVIAPSGEIITKTTLETRADLGVAFNGVHHLLAWSRVANPGQSPSLFEISALRVALDGTPVDAPVTVPLHWANGMVSAVQVVTDGNGWLATWNEVLQGNPTQTAIIGRVVNSDLTLGAEFVYSTSTFGFEGISRLLTHALANGEKQFFAWGVQSVGDEQRSVYVQRALLDGTVLDAEGFPVAATPDAELSGTLAFGSGRLLVGYRRGITQPSSTQLGLQPRFRFVSEAGGGAGAGGSAGNGGGGAAGVGGSGASAGTSGGGAGDGGSGANAGTSGGGVGGGGSSTGGQAGEPSEGGASGEGGFAGAEEAGTGGVAGATGGAAGETDAGGSAGSEAGTGAEAGSAAGGEAGSAGKGGSAGVAGTNAGSAGQKPTPPADGGCGCRIAPRRESNPSALGALLVLLSALVRRRRSRLL